MKNALVLFVALVTGSSMLSAEESDSLIEFKALTVETALAAAQAALDACRKNGYQVAVAVVDRWGVPQIVMRDRFAGPHSPDTAQRKAWTAVSFRTDTLSLSDLTQPGQPQSGARFIPGALMVGGGVPIETAGSTVGGIGVSGAPGGAEDNACAQAGIKAIREDLAF